MLDRVTTDQLPSGAAPAESPARAGRLRPTLEVGLVVLAFVLVAAGLGWWWWHLWSPAPRGQVFELRDADGTHQWFPSEAGDRRGFAGTGLYVTLAVPAALVLGAAAAGFVRRRPILTLAAVLVGSSLAAWVMYAVGTHFSPPDPQQLAAAADPGTELPGALQIHGPSAFLLWPAAALMALIVTNVLASYVGELRRQSGESETWLRGNSTG